MRRNNEERQANALWWLDRLPLILGAVMVVVLAALFVWTQRVDQRLGGIEKGIARRLRYQPPADDTPDALAASTDAEPEPSPPMDVGTPVGGDGQVQAVYVPVYSHIYHGEGEAMLLTATVSVRNTDRARPIMLHAARYFDSAGKLIRNYVSKPLRVPPLGTIEYLVEESDVSGGAGANFIVEWSATAKVSEPVIDAVMIGSAGGQGVSFLSAGVALER